MASDPLVGSWARLEIVQPNSYDFLARISLAAPNRLRWRFRGATPSPDEFVRSLWDGVLAQFLIIHRQSALASGLITSYNADLRNGFAYIAMLLDPAVQGQGWPMEGALLFVDYLFKQWGFRKIYFESSEHNVASFSSLLSRIASEEGRLLRHEMVDGEYQDHLILAIHRESWSERSAPYRPGRRAIGGETNE